MKYFLSKKKNDIVLSKGYEEVPQFESRIHRIEIINYFFYFKRSKRKTSEKLTFKTSCLWIWEISYSFKINTM